MNKELLKAILEAAKKTGKQVEVHEININDFKKQKEEYLKVRKVGEYAEVVIEMNEDDVISAIYGIIKALEDSTGIPRFITLNRLLELNMEDHTNEN